MNKTLHIHRRPMIARDGDEKHRAATALELLFDLVSVISIAAAAAGLHHAVAEAHVLEGLLKFSAAFFAIWLAWINYTWFASAYDNDDAIFRGLTMVIMAGSLALAAGIAPFFASTDLTLIVIGFVIMRLAMVAFWMRAAKHDPKRGATAKYYAIGTVLAQSFWVLFFMWQPSAPMLFYGFFAIGAALELAVPVLAEKQGATPWHRHHIIERYGLLNIIVLGETLLACSIALGRAFENDVNAELVRLAVEALVILFAMWWLYFSREDHLQEQNRAMAFTWGYGHIVIYMAGAAVGAGVAVMVDVMTHHAHLSLLAAQYAVAIPVAFYWLGLWFVRDRYTMQAGKHLLILFAGLILLAPLWGGLTAVAAFAVLTVWMRGAIVGRSGVVGSAHSSAPNA